METPADRSPRTARSLRRLAAGAVLAALPALGCCALVLAGAPTQAYAIDTGPRARDAGVPTAARAAPASTAGTAQDGTPDITALLLPVLGVLCLIARRQQSQRRP